MHIDVSALNGRVFVVIFFKSAFYEAKKPSYPFESVVER